MLYEFYNIHVKYRGKKCFEFNPKNTTWRFSVYGWYYPVWVMLSTEHLRRTQHIWVHTLKWNVIFANSLFDINMIEYSYVAREIKFFFSSVPYAAYLFGAYFSSHTFFYAYSAWRKMYMTLPTLLSVVMCIYANGSDS